MRAIDIPATDPALREALTAAGLHIDDLNEPGQRFLRFEDDRGTVLGFGGIALLGEAALLRSLVVLPDHRGCGHGAAMMRTLIAEAGAAGASHAFLLTLTAASLFERLGFRRLPRTAAPPVIAASRQFSALCPAAAVLMGRPVDRSGGGEVTE